MAQSHFMQLKDGPVIRVRLNEWASHRRKGYVFKTEQEFNDQSAEVKAERGPVKERKSRGFGRKNK